MKRERGEKNSAEIYVVLLHMHSIQQRLQVITALNYIRLVNRRIEQRQEHNITRTEITQR